jgi:hypothetical protein
MHQWLSKSLIPFLLLAAGCGYRFADPQTTLSIPYIQGDYEGQLNDALSYRVGASGAFDLVQNDGNLVLKIAIISSQNDRIGYRYDRKDISGQVERNLMGDEMRRTVAAEVILTDAATDKIIIGPTIVTAEAEYDYVNPDSLRELTFFDANGVRRNTLDFSLGQLDSNEGGHDSAATPLYSLLAQKITDLLIAAQ